jgi:hypothetical protein
MLKSVHFRHLQRSLRSLISYLKTWKTKQHLTLTHKFYLPFRKSQHGMALMPKLATNNNTEDY